MHAGCCEVDNDACQKRYHDWVNQCVLPDLFGSKCTCDEAGTTVAAAQPCRELQDDDDDDDEASGNFFSAYHQQETSSSIY